MLQKCDRWNIFGIFLNFFYLIRIRVKNLIESKGLKLIKSRFKSSGASKSELFGGNALDLGCDALASLDSGESSELNPLLIYRYGAQCFSLHCSCKSTAPQRLLG